MLRKSATVITAVGVLLAAVGKFINGEMPSMTEVTLAITTLTALFGGPSPKV